MGVRKIGLSLASLTPAIPTGSVAHGKRPAGTKKKKQRGKIVMETDMPQDVVDYQGRPVRTTPGTGGTGSTGTAPAPDSEELLKSYFIKKVYRDPSGRGKPLGSDTPHFLQAWNDFKSKYKFQEGKVVPIGPTPSPSPAPIPSPMPTPSPSPTPVASMDPASALQNMLSPQPTLQDQLLRMFRA